MPTADRLFDQRWPEGEYRMFQLGFVVDDLLAGVAPCLATPSAMLPGGPTPLVSRAINLFH